MQARVLDGRCNLQLNDGESEMGRDKCTRSRRGRNGEGEILMQYYVGTGRSQYLPNQRTAVDARKE